MPQTLRVLVVEDNPDVADMLNQLLVAWGQSTRVAHDPLRALELAEQFRPHVVLMDIGLPKLHGYELARRLRAQPWGRNITLVAITGWGQEADRAQSKAAGINHHLLKPVQPEQLQAILAEVKPEDV